MLFVQACSPSPECRCTSHGCPEVFFVEKSALHRMPMPSSLKRNITSQDGISYVQQFFAHGDECDFSKVFSTLYGGVVVLPDKWQGSKSHVVRFKKSGQRGARDRIHVHDLFCVFVCRCTWVKRARFPCPWRTMLCPMILFWWWFHLLKSIAPDDSLTMSYRVIGLYTQSRMIPNYASTQKASIPSWDWCTRSWCGPQDSRRAQSSSTLP